MKRKITVTVYGKNDKNVMKAIEARDGKPVEIKMWYTPKTCSSWHLSFSEATALADSLQAVREGAVTA